MPLLATNSVHLTSSAKSPSTRLHLSSSRSAPHLAESHLLSHTPTSETTVMNVAFAILCLFVTTGLAAPIPNIFDDIGSAISGAVSDPAGTLMSAVNALNGVDPGVRAAFSATQQIVKVSVSELQAEAEAAAQAAVPVAEDAGLTAAQAVGMTAPGAAVEMAVLSPELAAQVVAPEAAAEAAVLPEAVEAAVLVG
ncbi:uncharacterized protein EV422DRAFT_623555 [Fimicolochytrium jonesii]|uniref:uncharacterized protein n=1 Tax=Fimicolochytrium jonesii TaxID=1396493 RepID=UPI0022FDB61D|nr:uncharacterized protein EV422DRAFT_623555 [Fimicolochytrium jonesii]KAI8816336.1 hypothetical protein EV422DRAFT_623555 [Fimicolochytrium jonesii]